MAVDSAPNLRLLKAVVIILGIAIVVVLGIIVVTVIMRIGGDRQEAARPAPAPAPETPMVAGWRGERELMLPPGLGKLTAVESAGTSLILRYEAAGGDTVLVFVDLATGARRGLLRLKRPAD